VEKNPTLNQIQLVYTPLDTRFMLFYMCMYDLYAYLEDSPLIISTNITYLEALFFLNNKKTNRKMQINFFLLQQNHDFELKYQSLKKIYENPRLNYLLDKNIIDQFDEIISYYKKDVPDGMSFILCHHDFLHLESNAASTINELSVYANFLLALNLLRKGGTFVLEIENFTEGFALDLVCLMKKFFTQCKLYQVPITFDSYNFIVCEGFLGITKGDKLISIFNQWNKVYSSSDPTKLKPRLKSFLELTPDEITDARQTLAPLFAFIKKTDKIVNSFIEDTFFNREDMTKEDIQKFYNENYDRNKYAVHELCNKYHIRLKPDFIIEAQIYSEKMDQLNLSFPMIYDFSIVNYDYRIDSKKLNLKENYIYDYPELISEKETLNIYKLAIDSRNRERWSSLTHFINIPKYTVRYIKNNYAINVSRAFIKLYELLEHLKLFTDLIQTQGKNHSLTIRTLHICEAPGNFINAMNYYLKTKDQNIILDWHANSLNPNSPINKKEFGDDIFGDDLGYMTKYPKRWIWGGDQTGNIMHLINITYFETYFKDIDFISSDCGLGANETADFFDQEARLSGLNFAQILIGLLTLRIGGHGIWKIFIPVSEPITVNLIYLINLHFKECRLIKQTSGSPGSSEIYLVGIHKMNHMESTLRIYLLEKIKTWDPFAGYAIFPPEMIPDTFLKQLTKITSELVEKQILTLNRSIFYYDNPHILQKHKEHIEQAKKFYAINWIKVNKFKILRKELNL
jgi:hypothetical protein